VSRRYLYERPPAGPDPSGQRVLSLKAAPEASGAHEPVTVFVDYENMRLSLKNAFHSSTGHFDPKKLADLIVSRRRRRSVLTEVRVYRSIADPSRDRRRAQDDMRRMQRWLRNDRLVFVGCPLRYLSQTGVMKEKGIDISLAVDALVNSLERQSDVIVVASRDSDFVPLIDALMHSDAFGRHVELVGVAGLSRVTLPATELPWCHFLTHEDFESIRDDGQ